MGYRFQSDVYNDSGRNACIRSIRPVTKTFEKSLSACIVHTVCQITMHVMTALPSHIYIYLMIIDFFRFGLICFNYR